MMRTTHDHVFFVVKLNRSHLQLTMLSPPPFLLRAISKRENVHPSARGVKRTLHDGAQRKRISFVSRRLRRRHSREYKPADESFVRLHLFSQIDFYHSPPDSRVYKHSIRSNLRGEKLTIAFAAVRIIIMTSRSTF